MRRWCLVVMVPIGRKTILLAHYVSLDDFVEIVGFGFVAYQVRITQAAVVIDGGGLVVLVDNDEKRDGFRRILRGLDCVF